MTKVGTLGPGLRPQPRSRARLPQGPSRGRVRAARRIATAAAYGGGGLTLAGVTTVGLVLAQAIAARRWIEPRMAEPPRADGRYEPSGGVTLFAPDSVGQWQANARGSNGRGGQDQPIVLVLVGDSAAAGQGASTVDGTPGALLARGIAGLADRPVEVHVTARVGAVAAGLASQLDRLAAAGIVPDAAVIVIGANDVKQRVAPDVSVRHLATAVTRLRQSGCAVVVGTCPDLGTIRPLGQPLRSLARRWSRQLAAAQAIAVIEAGGRAVSIGDLMSVEFETQADIMFAEDRFHPSAVGYARAAEHLLPAVAAALAVLPVTWDDDEGGVDRLDLLAGVAEAAVVAAQNPGTEVEPARLAAGRDRRGRLARLRRRARAA